MFRNLFIIAALVSIAGCAQGQREKTEEKKTSHEKMMDKMKDKHSSQVAMNEDSSSSQDMSGPDAMKKMMKEKQKKQQSMSDTSGMKNMSDEDMKKDTYGSM